VDTSQAGIQLIYPTHNNRHSRRCGVFVSCPSSSILIFHKALGVTASDSACIYVIVTPTGPYFRGGTKPISLLAVSESVRSWPGGTGGHKLGLNYAPGFAPQRIAAKQGYDQILWLLGDDQRVTEAGAMNFFLIAQRDDGGTSTFACNHPN
jgi:branched-subunit amino acid aminotransferase/4-amino-4-deoxychorismate lyase